MTSLPPCVHVPPVSWGSGAAAATATADRWPRVPLSRRARGRDNAGHRCWGRQHVGAGGEKAFLSSLGYFCHIQSVVSVLGTRAGALLSPGGTAEQTQLCHEDAPGVKQGSEPTSLSNRLGFLFLFSPYLGGRSQFLWESQARPFPGPQCRPRSAPSPPRSARLRRKLLLMPFPSCGLCRSVSDCLMVIL